MVQAPGVYIHLVATSTFILFYFLSLVMHEAAIGVCVCVYTTAVQYSTVQSV